MAQMPKNRLKSVNRLGTTITTRRIGVGKALTTDTPPARSPRRGPGHPPPRAAPAARRRRETHRRARDARRAHGHDPLRLAHALALRRARAHRAVGDDTPRDEP